MSSTLRACWLSLVLCLAVTLPHPGICAAPPQGQAGKILQLQKKYQQLHSLEFEFSQATATNGRIKQGSGKAVFYRPAARPGGTSTTGGIMRWDYTEPTVQTIINDGKEFSIYTPLDKQLIVSPAGEMESDITYAIFTGTSSLLDQFVADQPDRQFVLNDPPVGFEAVLLTPRKPHSQLKRIQLWLGADQTIHRLLMEDHFGALTELTFTKVRFNALPTGDRHRAESLLKLDLADGTEIIRQ
jgi:outer membrane lipoprotein carrier protein